MTAALAPVRKTRMLRRITRAGMTGPECWGAETLDGIWAFEREESPGTPWLICHRESGIVAGQCSALRGCRAFVAAGHAEAALERLQAHDRGDHAAARDSWCVRC
jgi:hypothetical protein